MTTNWFKKFRWFYIPTSIIGIIITLAVVVFCITVFITIDKNAHSVSDTLYEIFPYFVSAFVILFWLASNTSGDKSNK